MNFNQIIRLQCALFVFIYVGLKGQTLMNLNNDPVKYNSQQARMKEHRVHTLVKESTTYKINGNDTVVSDKRRSYSATFDRTGKLLSDSISFKWEYIYNKADQLTQIKSNYTTILFDFDSLGHMILQTIISHDGKVYESNLHWYDSIGKLVRSDMYRYRPNVSIASVIDSVLTKRIKYYYDNYGRVVRQEINSRGERNEFVNRTYINKYTDTSIVFERISYNGDTMYSRFDTTGNLREYLIYNSIMDQRDYAFFTYSDEGMLLSKRVKLDLAGIAGTGEIITTYCYSKKGLLRKERMANNTTASTDIIVFTYTYTFYSK